MMDEKGINQIYVALEKLKDVELSGATVGSPEVAAVEPNFDTLIEHVHDQDIKVRNLLASEIPNYLHWFSSEPSMNAMLDLCEDSEPAVRISAIRGLQRFCEKAPSNVGRISDVLGQLLGTEDGAELKAVQSAFSGTIRVDFSAAIVTLVDLITNSETPESLRNRQIVFLREQLQAVIKEPLFIQNVAHQRTLFSQLRLLFLSFSGSLLPLPDAEFLVEMVKNVKLSRTEPSSLDEFASVLLQCFEKQLSAQATPFLDLLHYFGSIWKKLGAPAASGPITSFAYLTLFVRHFIPLWSPCVPTDLSASLQIFLRMLTYAAEGINDSQAAEVIPKFWDFLKQLISRTKPVSTASQIFEIECVLAAFVSLCSKNATTVKTVLGVFVPTGQPSDFRADLKEKRQSFQDAMSNINTEAAQQLLVFNKTADDYRKLLAASNDNKQKHEIKESISKLHSPTQGLQNIVAITKSLGKQRPVFNRSEISMSWVHKKATPQKEKGGEKKLQQQPVKKTQNVLTPKSQLAANSRTPGNHIRSKQNSNINSLDRKRHRQVVIEVQDNSNRNKKRSVKRNRRS